MMVNDILFHETNNGKWNYVHPEFNKLICRKDDSEDETEIIKKVRTCISKSTHKIFSLQCESEDMGTYIIGEGAEASVSNNTPFTVIKFAVTDPAQMCLRNQVPTMLPAILRAHVTTFEGNTLYIYRQAKVRIITKDELSDVFKELDVIMMKFGFFQVIGYSDEVIRVYTNGTYVIDDVSCNNIGIGLDHQIHIIDCSVCDIDTWEKDFDYQIPNKQGCIEYNLAHPEIPDQIKKDQEFTENNIKRAIREYERRIDKYIADNNLDIDYRHVDEPDRPLKF